MIGDSNDKTNFAHKLFITDTQIWRIHKAFAIGSSANIKFYKTQLSKMVQLGGFLPPIFKKMIWVGLSLENANSLNNCLS